VAADPRSDDDGEAIDAEIVDAQLADGENVDGEITDDGGDLDADHEPEGEDSLGPRPRLPRPSRRVMTILSIPLIAAVVGSYVGDALAPDLVNSNPLLLLILNPRNRNLLLITNQLDPMTYYIVGTLRLLATDPLWFLIGIWYGESAIRWAERRTRTFGETLRWMERGFSKAAYPLVLIAPNNWICLFAGAAGMGVAVFVVLNVVGTVARLWLIREAGEVFESPIDSLLSFISDYRGPLLVISITLVVLTVYFEMRKGGGEIGALSELDEVVGSEDDAAEEPGSSRR
jgi:membrane protein DedA with SNARE-associated domain